MNPLRIGESPLRNVYGDSTAAGGAAALMTLDSRHKEAATNIPLVMLDIRFSEFRFSFARG
jgi:hypothetical protein